MSLSTRLFSCTRPVLSEHPWWQEYGVIKQLVDRIKKKIVKVDSTELHILVYGTNLKHYGIREGSEYFGEYMYFGGRCKNLPYTCILIYPTTFLNVYPFFKCVWCYFGSRRSKNTTTQFLWQHWHIWRNEVQ